MKRMNHLGIDVGKRKCRAVLKDDKGKILDEFFFGNDRDGIHNLLSRIQSHGKCSTRAVFRVYRKHVDKNSWYTFEENEIDTKLANPYKTKR